MSYSQKMYESMDDMKYYGAQGSSGGGGHGGKMGSGRFKYDVGYGAKYDYKKGMGENHMYMERGNNYNATDIKDKLEREN